MSQICQLHLFINTKLINSKPLNPTSTFSHMASRQTVSLQATKSNPLQLLWRIKFIFFFFLTARDCMPISEVSSSDYIAGCSPHSKPEHFPATTHPCLQYTQGMHSYNCFCVSVCNYNPSLCSSKEKNWNK